MTETVPMQDNAFQPKTPLFNLREEKQKAYDQYINCYTGVEKEEIEKKLKNFKTFQNFYFKSALANSVMTDCLTLFFIFSSFLLFPTSKFFLFQ